MNALNLTRYSARHAPPTWALCLLLMGMSSACSSDSSSLKDHESSAAEQAFAGNNGGRAIGAGLEEGTPFDNSSGLNQGSDSDPGSSFEDAGAVGNPGVGTEGTATGDLEDKDDVAEIEQNGRLLDGGTEREPLRPTPPASDEPLAENPKGAPKICAPLPRYNTDLCKSYVPQFPLWSDDLKKDRYVFLPAATVKDDGTIVDASLRTADPNRWAFPEGTRFYKNFSQGDKLLETRVITKIADADGRTSWDFKVYVWTDNDAEPKPILHAKEDAAKTMIGQDESSQHTDVRGSQHAIPNADDCKRCHARDGGKDSVLGFGALQLDHDLADYSLTKLKAEHRVPETVVNLLKDTKDAPGNESAGKEAFSAIGYLHGNCGGCHVPGGDRLGAKPTLQLFADITKGIAEQPVMKGVCQCNFYPYPIPMGGANKAPHDVTMLIDRGNPENSKVFGRMSYREVGQDRSPTQMPPIGSKDFDPKGLATIGSWITSLPGQCAVCPDEP